MEIDDLPAETFELLRRALESKPDGPRVREVGTVTEVSDAIAHVQGFTGMTADEIVRFPQGMLGIASSLTIGDIGVILLGDAEQLRVGDEARRTGRVVDVPVGPGLLGRVVDALGRPLDDKGPVKAVGRWPIERPAPPIIDRAPVTTPLQTGLKAVDAVIPIGRGQRELIVGDRQTGKTAVALDTMINQRDQDMVCIYCATGQRAASVANVIADLRAHGAMERIIVVVAGGEDAPGLQFIAPYAATTMAEFFMEDGGDALVVYDDLTRHARTYRELALLLRRPPGREAYPGDIFYIHSRLLERATHLCDAQGGGSLTALPIIETQAQNISAYIPTNLISITDGQIYLSPELFHRGHLPAIDIGKSVSRVGGKAQLPAFRAVAGDLRLSYSQFEELEAFSRFGTRLDERTRASLERGLRVREVLRQAQHQPMPVAEQIAVLYAVTQGVFDSIAAERVGAAEAIVAGAIRATQPDLCARIERGAELTGEDRDLLRETAWAALDQAELE